MLFILCVFHTIAVVLRILFSWGRRYNFSSNSSVGTIKLCNRKCWKETVTLEQVERLQFNYVPEIPKNEWIFSIFQCRICATFLRTLHTHNKMRFSTSITKRTCRKPNWKIDQLSRPFSSAWNALKWAVEMNEFVWVHNNTKLTKLPEYLNVVASRPIITGTELCVRWYCSG